MQSVFAGGRAIKLNEGEGIMKIFHNGTIFIQGQQEAEKKLEELHSNVLEEKAYRRNLSEKREKDKKILFFPAAKNSSNKAGGSMQQTRPGEDEQKRTNGGEELKTMVGQGNQFTKFGGAENSQYQRFGACQFGGSSASNASPNQMFGQSQFGGSIANSPVQSQIIYGTQAMMSQQSMSQAPMSQAASSQESQENEHSK